jgi:MFS family permease
MFPPERRARGMSVVLFAVVFGAVWGPLVFGPMFSGRSFDASDLTVPWLCAGLFTVGGLLISFGVRRDPRDLSRAYDGETTDAKPLREILKRPGVMTALVAAVASFGVMAGVMNLAGYVAVGHHHAQGSVFTIISLHIVGMYGLVLFAGDVIERLGRYASMLYGLVLIALSNAGMAWAGSIAAMSLCMVGLGLGWCLSYIAATTELVNLAGPAERGRLVGFSDLLSSFAGATLALAGGVVYTGAGGSVPLAGVGAGLAFLAAAWVLGSLATIRPRGSRAVRLFSQ